MKNTVLVLLLVMFCALSAQWSNDPEMNNRISYLGGDQAIPKTAQFPDGSCYFGWWSNDTGNYNMRLQYLDSDGNEVWEQSGMLVSDHTQMSWLTEWDMTVDLEGNAILALNDIRVAEGQLDIIAYKISPEGEFLWGDDGINLSNGGFNAAPVVTVTDNNYCIFAWADETTTKVMSITPTGELAWEQPIILNELDTTNWPQLLPATDDGSEGDFLLKYFVNTGPYWSPNRAVYMQKYDMNGNPVWDSPAVVSDAYGISAWTQFFSVTPDGSGGAVIAWHDDRLSENTSRAYVQHITTDGTAVFEDGILVADHAPDQMYYPSAIYQPETELIYVSWRETDAGQNNAGVFAQKINSDGELLFTNTGVNISPIQSTGGTLIGIRPFGEDIVAVYSLYPWGNFSNEQILAERVNPDGDIVWNETLIISDMQSEKMHTNLADVRWTDEGFAPDDAFVISWGSGQEGIYAQRFNDDGTIGGEPIELPAPINLTAEVEIYNVMLDWDMPDERALTGFQVYRNDEMLYEIIDPDTHEFEDYVWEYITYEYYVVAVYDEGISAPSNTVAATVVEYPFPPSDLVVDCATGLMTWQPPAFPDRDLEGYNIYLEGNLEGQTSETSYQLTDLIATMNYVCGLSARYTDSESAILELEFIYSPVAGDENDIPQTTALLGNYPNPFNPSTAIDFQLAKSGNITLNIYNSRGQLTQTLYKGFMTSGTHSLNWEADSQPSGIYFYTLTISQNTLKSKMLLIK